MESPSPLPSLHNVSQDGFSPSSISPLMARVAMITPKKQYIEPAYRFNSNEIFKQSFMDGGPVNGLLDREEVLEIFISRFSLSFQYIAQLFELVDLTSRNSLDIEEFCLGMHFLEALDSKLPLTIPPAIPNEIRVQLRRLEYQVMNTNISVAISPPASKPLSAEAKADMEYVRKVLMQEGHMKGEMLTRLRVRHNIQPSEMAAIWNSTVGDKHTRVQLSSAAIDAVILRIQERIEKSGSSTLPPSPAESSSSSALDNSPSVPDFANLPQRIASPAISTYSSSTGTTHSAPDVVPFPYWRQEEQWSHTESSVAATSMIAPSSYAGSCFDSKVPSLRKGKHPYQPTPFRYNKDVPAGNQYISEDLERMRAEMQELKIRLSEVLKNSSKPSGSYSGRDTLDLIDSPSSTSPISAAQRILLLRASLRRSQDEARRAKEEVENLQELVAVQEIELSELYNHQINKPKLAGDVPQNVVGGGAVVAGGLETQMQSVLGMMETLLGSLNVNNATNIGESAARGAVRDESRLLAHRTTLGAGRPESQVRATFSTTVAQPGTVNERPILRNLDIPNDYGNRYLQRDEYSARTTQESAPPARRVHYADTVSEHEYEQTAWGSQSGYDETSIQSMRFETYEPSESTPAQANNQFTSRNEATGVTSSGLSYVSSVTPSGSGNSAFQKDSSRFQYLNSVPSTSGAATVNENEATSSRSTRRVVTPSSTPSESLTSRAISPPPYSALYTGQIETFYRDTKYPVPQEQRNAGYGQYRGTRERLPISTGHNHVENNDQVDESVYFDNYDLDNTYQAVKASESSSSNPQPTPKSRQLLTRLAKSFKRDKKEDKLQTWYRQSSHDTRMRQYRQAIKTIQEMDEIREGLILQSQDILQLRQPGMIVNNPDDSRQDGDDRLYHGHLA